MRKAFEDAGFHVDPKGQIVPNRHASLRFWLMADADGLHVGATQHGQNSAHQDPPIEYDAALDQWVGKADDTYFTPMPGEPTRRRSAVAVVVEMIAKAMP